MRRINGRILVRHLFWILIACHASVVWAVNEPEYASVEDAIAALAGPAIRSQMTAAKYLAQHPDQSVRPLMTLVEKREKGWIFGCSALSKCRDERVVPFFVRLLRNNFYEKEADGTRKQYGFGSTNGCMVFPFLYGGVLARTLGEMGDKQAIPVLKEAIKEGDAEVKLKAYLALYKLGGLSLDELFDVAKKNSDPRMNFTDTIVGVGWSSIHSDSPFALVVFDRIIRELPDQKYAVASAHYWKIQCFELRKHYTAALLECDEVMKFPEFPNLTRQMGERRAKLKALLDAQPR